MAKKPAPRRSSREVAGPSPSDPEMRKYRARDAYETISRAEEHKKDPGLMRDVKKHAADQAKKAAAIAKGCR